MKVKIINSAKVEINQKGIKQWIRAVTSELKSRNIPLQFKKETGLKMPAKAKTAAGSAPQVSKQPANVTLVFISKQEMQKLNHQFRKKNSPADILSFAPLEKDSLGELALCLSVVYQNTPKGLSNKKWLYYLILHGLLHLLGFEHEKKMYQLQDSIFKKLI